MDTLLNVEAVTSPHNLKGLRQLYDNVESHVRSLNTLGVAAESYGSLLASVLMNKLPHDLQLIISRKTSDAEWKLDSLLTMVEEELTARERTAMSSAQQPVRRSSEKTPHTATSLTSGTPSTSSSPLCCYCQQAHSSTTCKTVTQVDARKQILRRSGRCYACLRKGHIGRDCRSPNKCTKCNGRHHASICERDSKEPTRPAPSNPQPQGSTPASRTGLSRGASLPFYTYHVQLLC